MGQRIVVVIDGDAKRAVRTAGGCAVLASEDPGPCEDELARALGPLPR